MAENDIISFRKQFGIRRDKATENTTFSSSALAENMREQPEATKLVYSPRRAGKTAAKSDENDKSSQSVVKRSTKGKSDHESSSSSLPVVEKREKRKSLQLLQPSADGQKLLTGGKSNHRNKPKGKTRSKSAWSSTQKQLKHYLTKSKDVETQSSSSDVESNTTSTAVQSDVHSDIPTSSDEAHAMMVQDRAPEKYWELVAEERRKALEETLNENMKLYEVIESLKAENEALKEKANNAEYFATMYKIAKDDVLRTTLEEDKTGAPDLG